MIGNETLKIIKQRRSIRNFKAEQIGVMGASMSPGAK